MRGLPRPPQRLRFDAVPAALAEDLERRLARARRTVEAAIAAGPRAIVAALELTGEDLDRRFAPLRHLNAVNASPEIRAAFERALAAFTDYRTWLEQHPQLHRSLREFARSRDFAKRPAAERALVRHALTESRLSGTELPPNERGRVRTLLVELAELGNRFETQLLDATDAWSRLVSDATGLAGVPADTKALLAERARARGRRGWLVTLDASVVDAVLAHADDRGLRREVYEAWTSRASDAGPLAGRFDNGPLIAAILVRRQELARTTGFANYAEYALVERMARSADEVAIFLRDLARRARSHARAEFEELARFASTRGLADPLAPWDLAYYSEKLRAERYGFDEESLRRYFPLEHVLAGLRSLFRSLYGIRFRRNPTARTWHPDAVCWEIADARGTRIGRLYLDLYARPGKRGGAWMDEGGHRLELAGVRRRPIAFLTANFMRPARGRQPLLAHDDVVTLCHEFGHCLHHLLTRVTYPSVGGIGGVEWDAVEFPSQLHEEFAWHPRGLALLAAECRTGAPLPHELVAALGASRRFQAALRLLRQIEFALFDIELHRRDPATLGPRPADRILAAVRREVRIAPLSPLDRSASSFSHVFGGGYAAGYYGYLWAEIMARDGFAAFVSGERLLSGTGRRFRREVLAVGGSRSARDSYRAFRGRDPEPGALLEVYGIV